MFGLALSLFTVLVFVNSVVLVPLFCVFCFSCLYWIGISLGCLFVDCCILTVDFGYLFGVFVLFFIVND